MKYTVNKETKTIELHSGIISYDDIKGLVEQFEGFSFSVSSQKSEITEEELNKLKNKLIEETNKKLPLLFREGMVVGNAYVPIISKIEHS